MSNARNLGNITTSGLTGDLVVDTNTLVVDSANNRVGIGTASPTTALDVSGTITATSLSGNVTGQVSDISNHNTDDLTEGTNLYYTDARVDARLASGSVGNIITTGYIAGPATFTIDPAAVGDNTGTVVIAGNLQVDGTQTIVNSTAVEIGDKNIILGADATANSQNNGAGLTILQPNSADHALFTYNETTSTFEVNRNFSLSTTSMNNTDTARITQTGTGNNNKFVIQAEGSNSSSPTPVYAALELVGRAYDNTASTHGRHALIWVEPGNLGDSYQSDLHFSVRRNASEINLPNESTNQMSSLLKLTYTGNLENLTGDIIVNTGKIGIGIANPSAPLHIRNSQTITANTNTLLVDNYATGQPAVIGMRAVADNGGAGNTGAIYFDAGADGSAPNNIIGFNANHQTDTNYDVVINGDGNVGIGTVSPTVPLHISSTATSMARFVGPNDGNLYITNDSSNVVTLQAAAGDSLSFNTNGGNERMRISSAGTIGIGADPTGLVAPLNIQADTNARSIRIIGRSDDYGEVDFYENDNTTILSRIQAHNTMFNIRAYNVPMQFQQSGVTKMVLTTGGNVGIGSTNPPDKLYVLDGDIGIENTGGRRYRLIAEGSGGFTIRDQNAAQTRLHIDTAGEIAIGGHSNPVMDLDVNQSIRIGNQNDVNNSGVGGIMLSHTMTLAAGVQTDMIRLGNREGCFVLTVYIGWSDSGAAAVAQYDVHTFYATNTINQVKRVGRSGGNDVGLAITSVTDYHTFKVTSSNNSVVTITVIGTSAGRVGASSGNHFTVDYY